MAKSAGLLCAFRHPLVLISILVLLLNDHVLKVSMPSELTGKLSDLAGLFFFPFLVGMILQGMVKLAWPARRMCARQALAVSFILSAAVFIGIKTFPMMNELLAGLLSTLFHLPVRIALDPTDLGALVVFIPAWLLWGRIEREPRMRAPRIMEYAVLSLGALACVATSPCMPIPSIQRLLSINDTVYAKLQIESSGGYLSRDLGTTWEIAQTIPPDILADMAGMPELPLILCKPEDEQVCYRIDGQAWVEGSQDGGISWQVVWRIPAGRESYLQRSVQSGLMSCGKDPNVIPQDIAFVTRGESSTLVVAMGNEGVVIHPPSGAWQRVAVGTFMLPSPITARNMDEAFTNIYWESILGLVGGGLIYLGLSIWAWIFAARHASPTAIRKPKWIFRPARFVAAWILLLVAIPLLNGIIRDPLLNFINFVWLFAAVTFPLGILIISITIWMRAGSLAACPGRYRLYGLAALLSGIAICAVFIGCLLLWALGIIVMYESALVRATIFGVFILSWSVILMRRGIQLALSGTDNRSPQDWGDEFPKLGS